MAGTSDIANQNQLRTELSHSSRRSITNGGGFDLCRLRQNVPQQIAKRDKDSSQQERPRLGLAKGGLKLNLDKGLLDQYHLPRLDILTSSQAVAVDTAGQS